LSLLKTGLSFRSSIGFPKRGLRLHRFSAVERRCLYAYAQRKMRSTHETRGKEMAIEEKKAAWMGSYIHDLPADRGPGFCGTAIQFDANDFDLLDVSSGMPAMDKLHHDFFQALDRLSTASDTEFRRLFAKFVAQVEQAFRREDEWMEEVDLPTQQAHREQHARVLGALHNVHMRVDEGNVKLGREVIESLLPQWFSCHITTMDAPLARAMQHRHRHEHIA
jgi:hemerythrin-like metal-binding protein